MDTSIKKFIRLLLNLIYKLNKFSMQDKKKIKVDIFEMYRLSIMWFLMIELRVL